MPLRVRDGGLNQDGVRLRSPTGDERMDQDNMLLKDLQTPRGGGIFVELRCLKWRTHSVGEIYFNESFCKKKTIKKIVYSSYDS